MQNTDTIKILHRHAAPWRLLSGTHRGTWLSTAEINQLTANPSAKHAIKHTITKLGDLRRLGIVQSRREGNQMIWAISDRGMAADVVIVPRIVTEEQRAKYRAAHARMMAIRAARAAGLEPPKHTPPPKPERYRFDEERPTQVTVPADKAAKLILPVIISTVFDLGKLTCAQ
jgi:hypothetical protein